MKTFDNIEMKQFKDLSPDEMHCIVRASAEGKLQYYHGGSWCDAATNADVICKNVYYRTKPLPAKKLNIPWAVLDKKWKYATYDSYGVLLWNFKPLYSVDNKEYLCITGQSVYIHNVSGILNIDLDGVEYATSLTERPEGV